MSTPMVWEAPWPVGTQDFMIPQGKFAVQKVSVQKGENIAVALKYSLRYSDDRISEIQPKTEKIPLWASSYY